MGAAVGDPGFSVGASNSLGGGCRLLMWLNFSKERKQLGDEVPSPQHYKILDFSKFVCQNKRIAPWNSQCATMWCKSFLSSWSIFLCPLQIGNCLERGTPRKVSNIAAQHTRLLSHGYQTLFSYLVIPLKLPLFIYSYVKLDLSMRLLWVNQGSVLVQGV